MYLNSIGLTAFGSVVCGVLAGFAWRLGNTVADAGLLWLVLLAIPSNLILGLAIYFALRGSEALSNGGTGWAFGRPIHDVRYGSWFGD